MKIDFIIISCILVIICFLPFILFPYFGRKEEQSIKRKFREEALKLGLNIGFELHWNTNRTGIDVQKKQLLLVQKPDMDFEIKKVDLNKVSNIKMKTHFINVKQQGKQVEILSRIELEFHINNYLAPVVVTVFDHDRNYNQDFEIGNTQKLVAELQKYLSAQPVLKHTA
jgi:hypothetical protein